MKTLRAAAALTLILPWQSFAQMPGRMPGQGGGRDRRPQPPMNRPQPPVNRPEHRPQPPVNRPQPPVNRPERRPQPPVNRPQPPVNRPEHRPQPPAPRPQPPVNRPDHRPQPPAPRPLPPSPRPIPPSPRPIPPSPRPVPPAPRPQPPVNRPPHRPQPPQRPHPLPPVNRRPPVAHPEPGHRLPRPDPARDWPRDGRMPQRPTQDGRGGWLGGQRFERAPGRVYVDRTINNVTVVNNIHVRVGMGGLTPGAYYWFYDGGMRYAHYYDAARVHWFGFYLGDVYFWTRWHNDRLWWHDEPRGRWLCWREGQWWWQDGSVVYIYRDGAYYRWTPVRGGYEAQPEPPTSAPAPTPAEPAEKTEFYSEDGSRLVKVFGDKKEAFLYDNTGEEPAFLAFLAEGAEAVQFSSDGALTILVTLTAEDGGKSFKLFDAAGKEFGAPADSVDPDSQLGTSPAFKALEGKTAF